MSAVTGGTEARTECTILGPSRSLPRCLLALTHVLKLNIVTHLIGAAILR